ncbi:CC0125/CC1285 family lipoprotein [Rhizobacter sp. P5_C2]
MAAIAAAWCLGLAGCATGYGSQGYTGGYFEKSAPGKMQWVYFSGNAYVTADVISRFGLYRCAELARAQHKPHFVIYERLVDAARDRPADGPNTGLIGGKPYAATLLLMLDEPRYGSKSTQQVLDDLDSLVHPKTPKAAS